MKQKTSSDVDKVEQNFKEVPLFPQCLLPSIDGIQLETLQKEDQTITFVLTLTTPTAVCPLCHQQASRVHSRYVRKVADLPWAGVRTRLHLNIRRFFCDNRACTRRVFAERLGAELSAYARRTTRLVEALRNIAFTGGGESGARLAHAQGMPASPRTLLRLLQAHLVPQLPPSRVVGIDEWAWKKGRTYGTILVDLEQKRPVDLLPDREVKSVASWFRAHPEVEIIARDRSGLYAEAALQGAPSAVQVADRFHIVHNLVEALERFFLHKRTVLKAVHTQQQEAETPAGSLPLEVDGRQTFQPLC